MEWTPGGTSQDIEDRRDDSGDGGSPFGGFGFGHLGIGGVLVVGLLSFVFHQNFFALFSGDGAATREGTRSRSARNAQLDQQERPEVEFISFVLDDVQRNWDRVLPQQAGISYHHARLVFYRDSYPSACGRARDATGPFYCPVDEKVYLDLGFFQELNTRFGASNGEFAQAYVVAHEIGHHVQKVLGIAPKVHALQQRRPAAQANALSVRLELQADCLAGVWGHSTQQRKIIDEGDIAQAMSAAAAVGDDRLQKMATGHVSPEQFTHGSAAQRTTWFKRGLDSGRVSSCNTFAR
ncbi:MAG TPA: neutral zinc metallopeptidase [Bryobacteraceae bacterium]|nr:neutral zinc metallopeptidase [Bryobacteraceae bacterium]